MLGSNLILHLIPVASFRSRQLFDVATMQDLNKLFDPLDAKGWDYRLNLDGFVAYSTGRNDRTSRAYTQLFRNGIVEAVLADVVSEIKESGKLLSTTYYERTLTQGRKPVERLLNGLRQIGIQPPVWGFLTITGVKGTKVTFDREAYGDDCRAIDRDILMLPEFVFDDFGKDVAAILRPVFNLVWNASGLVGSPNFDAEGKWVGR